MIDTPNEAYRLIALGARFAVEQQYQEQIVTLANQRDQALAAAQEANRKVEEMQQAPAEPTPGPVCSEFVPSTEGLAGRCKRCAAMRWEHEVAEGDQVQMNPDRLVGQDKTAGAEQ